MALLGTKQVFYELVYTDYVDGVLLLLLKHTK